MALVMGGRHPGHYFMDSDDFNDIVSRNKVEFPTLVMVIVMVVLLGLPGHSEGGQC